MYVRPDPVAQADAPPKPAPFWHRAMAFLLKAALPVALLLAAAEVARDIMASAPAPMRAAAERQARLVEVSPVAAAAQGPVIEAWGIVEPQRRLVLRPEVGGRIGRLNPALTPGGVLAEGDVLLELDDRDARLQLAEAEAEIARIDAEIRMEAGQQDRARRDLARNPVRSGITEEQRGLILREPQMAELQANRAGAEARRDAANLAIEKAVIRAPFDAVVESEDLAPGTVLMEGSEVARLVATDVFRVVLALPPSELVWLRGREGAEVVLRQPGVWPAGEARTGRLARLGAELSEIGRMAEVVVEVRDPLASETAGPRLLLGSFLAAEIHLPAIPGSVVLDRVALRDGDTVWVAAEGQLEIRPVTVAWRGPEAVLVTDGLAPGEEVVTTRIETVADGMAIRLGAGG